MPNIKTIKPDGTGDFTTLSAWWNYAKVQASADQWAECYSGGNLGTVLLSGMTATPSSTVYPRIYVATGHGHLGTLGTGAFCNVSTGACIDVRTNYMRVEGLRIQIQGVAAQGIILQDCTEARAFGNLVVSEVTATTARGINIVRSAGHLTNITAYILNNLILSANRTSNTYQSCIRITGGALPAGFQLTVIVANNSFENGSSAVSMHGFQLAPGAVVDPAAVIAVTLKNNAAGESGTGSCFTVAVTGASPTITATNNASKDATADDWGGSGNLINQSRTSMWVDPNNHNLRPKRLGPLVDAGADVSSYMTTDILGASRNLQVATDIGAFEQTAPFNVSASNSVSTSSTLGRQALLTRSLTDSVGITDAILKSAIFNRSILSEAAIDDDLAKSTVFNRSVLDSLSVVDSLAKQSLFNRSLDSELSLADAILKQTVVQRLLSNDIELSHSSSSNVEVFVLTDRFVLQAPFPRLQTTSHLPRPEFSDSIAPTSVVQVKIAMDGTLRTHVKTKGNRMKLQWTFQLTRNKAMELSAFIRSYFASKVKVVDHNGGKWIGHFMNNPFEFETTRRAAPAISPLPKGEHVLVTLEFEGVRQ